MPRPDYMTWHEYLRGYGALRWASADHERRYHEINGLLQPIYGLMYGNLMDSTCPKLVVALPTPVPVQRRGHPPYTFKLQCRITGRLSQAIPYERFIEFGILTCDTEDGGPFQKGPFEVEDRLAPVAARLNVELEEVKPQWDAPGEPWDQRYTEYLQSEEWLALRTRVLKRDGHRCQWTGKSARPGDPLQVHHLTYERVGCEHLDDLVTVCRSAHRAHHLQKAA